MEKMYEIKAEGNKLYLNIHGNITNNKWNEDESVNNVSDLDKILNKNKDAAMIEVSINSSGGSVFEGLAIYNMLKRHKAYKKVIIEGCACSIASVIAMCGNQIIMPKSSIMMIHKASSIVMGNAKHMRKCAEDLEKIDEVIKNSYLKRFNSTESELDKILDDETFLTADECLKYGLATSVSEDGENDKAIANKVIDDYTNILNNKFENLKQLKEAIKSIENVSEIDNTEESKEIKEMEDSNEVKLVIDENKKEFIEKNKAIKIAKNEVKEINENALMRFFNLSKEEEKENE